MAGCTDKTGDLGPVRLRPDQTWIFTGFGPGNKEEMKWVYLTK
jgi:hypothetical protein